MTNDDGWDAPGLAALAAELVAVGHDVVVVAPLEDRSGSGASIGPVHLGQTLRYERVSIPGLEGVSCYALDGPPALAVMTARLGGFGPPPEMVASGINPGPNTGRATLHSGTVGAALTAANFGMSAVAVSMEVGEDQNWSTAARLGAVAVEWLTGAPLRTVLNLNVPNLPLESLRGLRRAQLAPFGTVRAAVVEGADGHLEVEMREVDSELPADSDTALIGEGYATITPLVGIRPSPDHPGVADELADMAAVGSPS
ncbi:MAG TPA: 5'/3'-nucleotidase SurE [Acidimicrobiales bacterium]|nr:5'/3'-nucleotidase SurE [Acidimicrobiales bacterium]